MAAIKNLVFDLGNVLITFDPLPFMMDVLGDEELSRECVKKIFHDQIWRDMDGGLLTVEEGKRKFIATNPELEEPIHALFAHWLDMFQPIEENTRLLPELKQNGYNLFVLSNCIKESYEALRSRADFFQWMDGVVASYEIKMTKPDRAIYDYLLSAHALIGEETLFFDDLPENIEGARAAGIHAEWIETPNRLPQILKENGFVE